jgi:hypothetical protein
MILPREGMPEGPVAFTRTGPSVLLLPPVRLPPLLPPVFLPVGDE